MQNWIQNGQINLCSCSKKAKNCCRKLRSDLFRITRGSPSFFRNFQQLPIPDVAFVQMFKTTRKMKFQISDCMTSVFQTRVSRKNKILFYDSPFSVFTFGNRRRINLAYASSEFVQNSNTSECSTSGPPLNFI
eukprot:Pompholyxophrys_punicea_v1_NODE_622_length_1578_cov_9.930401.p2 type:complete len:133 gc:universal NODE_622_length_1578_cov_9.930401:1436-1038(-)